jgi:hypothetical protein
MMAKMKIKSKKKTVKKNHSDIEQSRPLLKIEFILLLIKKKLHHPILPCRPIIQKFKVD